MTTRLAGKGTRFLPFNKGITNPVNPEGHKVSYMWEELFQKSSLLDLIQNYVLIRKEKDPETNVEKELLIFPRYLITLFLKVLVIRLSCLFLELPH